jgi:CheY-like chemotaxis protein/DNA-binding XRE family transcriptional regulator
MNNPETCDPVYACIGQRIRDRRKLLKLNQVKLAELMGFSYQQMQKYESGASHVSTGKLLLFAKILNVPPSFFYEGINVEETIGARIEPTTIQKIRTRALNVWVVDDRAADVILLNTALKAYNQHADLHVIHEAETAMDALLNYQTGVNQKKPDIVLLDLSLPKLSGMELLKSIKKHPQTLALPVIILTNSISMKDMLESYRHGAAGFIQKSVDLDGYMEDMDVLFKYWSKTVSLP